MAGVKGRSGRRTNYETDIRHRVITKAWEILEKDLNDPNLDQAIKRDIALKIAPKNIPTELSGSLTSNVAAMGTIEKTVNGVTETLKFNIGTPVDDDQADPPSNPESA